MTISAGLRPSISARSSIPLIIEIGAGYFENPANGTAILYFTSNRAGGLGDEDIYQSTRNANGTFNAPTNVAALNSPSLDRSVERQTRRFRDIFCIGARRRIRRTGYLGFNPRVRFRPVESARQPRRCQFLRQLTNRRLSRRTARFSISPRRATARWIFTPPPASASTALRPLILTATDAPI